MLDLQAVPTPSEDLRVREVGDETVFLTASGREVVSLNAVGTFIWQQIDGHHTLRDILDIICHEYEVEPDRAEADLARFVDELEQNNLLTLQSPEA